MRSARHPVVIVVGVVLLVDTLMLVTDTGPNLVALSAIGALVGAIVWFLVDVRTHVVRPRPATTGSVTPDHRSDLRITTLRQALAYGNNDQYLAERVHTSLVAVVDDELRETHGIDRAHDPEAARMVIGPELDRFVDDPAAAVVMTAHSLSHIVTLIERI